MKKFYLFLLLLVSAVSANAQTFDEADLVGTWSTQGLAYAPYKISNIESITLGDGMYEYGKGLDTMSGMIKNMTYTSYSYDQEETRTKEMASILDYFITNNNKLHIIQQDNFVLHFIIEELTATTLKVKTYDGQSYSFTKDNSGSDVRSLTQTRSADESTYNLSGQKVEKVTADGIYIQNGQKKVVKR